MPLGNKLLKANFLMRLIGPLVKKQLYNDKPWRRNLPTAPPFIIKGQRDFEKEKQELINLINRFYEAGPGVAGRFPHPVFGKFTPEQWGKSMWKHMDHHLRQFGV